MLILIIITFIIILIIELPKLIEDKSTKDLIVFSVFYSVALIFSILLAVGVNIPSPVMPIYNFIKDLYGGYTI